MPYPGQSIATAKTTASPRSHPAPANAPRPSIHDAAARLQALPLRGARLVRGNSGARSFDFLGFEADREMQILAVHCTKKKFLVFLLPLQSDINQKADSPTAAQRHHPKANVK